MAIDGKAQSDQDYDQANSAAGRVIELSLNRVTLFIVSIPLYVPRRASASR